MKIKEKLDEYGERRKWFGTVLAVQKRYSELNGNYLASAVTLTAFLSIFPLLLVAIAIVGFLAAGKADFSADVIEYLGITDDARDSITTALEKAQESRRLASIIGIVGLLWSGLGLVAAVQYAIN
nr:YihY/virulence factor BrkB family protein [Actinomycetota bacterium]